MSETVTIFYSGRGWDSGRDKVIDKQRNVFHKEDANIIVTRAMAYILESFKEDKKYFDYNVAPDEGLWMQVGNRKITVDATDKTVKSIWGMKFKFDNEFNVIGSEYKNIIEWMKKSKDRGDVMGVEWSLKL